MKKETIFKHELNESIQANAALNCLKNRNDKQQMNEALPLVAGAIRLAMPLLRPLITKLVKSLVMKAGAKLTGRQVAKMVIKNVANGKTIMKVGKKVGQTWTEIPAELKQEIAKTAINTFKEMRQPKQEVATQEQEETSEFDNRFALRSDLKDMANDVTKKAYMLIRKEFGDSMWRQLGIDDCNERGLIDMLNDYQKYFNITNPQDLANKMLGRKATEQEETVDYVSEQEEVNSVRSSLPVQYEQYVLPDICDMVADKGISEEEVKSRLLNSHELPWEYDEIEEWVAKNFAEEQEEVKLTESEIEELTFKLADYLMESFIILEDDDEDYPNLLEAVEKILRKDAPKSDTDAGYYDWCRKWFMKIEDLTYSYYNEPNPMSYYTDEEDEEIGINKHGMHNLVQHGHIMNTPSEDDEDDFEWVFDAARDIINKKFVGKSLTEIAPDQVKDDIRSMIMKEYKTRPRNAKEHYAWVHNIELAFDYATNYNFEREEQEEKVYSDVLNKIINDGLDYWDVWEMAKQGKATKTELEISNVLLDLFETLMYNGYGEILSKVSSGEIDKRELKRIIVDVLMEQDVDTFPKDESEYNSWVNEHNSEIVKRLEAKFNEEQEELPSMERHDMILALSEYMSESWIDTGDDGDLDDIYYAIAAILDETGDYPKSTDWKDCKPWCQKYYQEVEARIQ